MVTKTNSIENPNFSSSYVFKRTYTQIFDTFKFEIVRNLRKFLLILGLFFVVFLIFFLNNINTYSDPNNLLPTLSNNYILGYLDVIGIMILVLAVVFGASTIVEDFEKQTGNLMFPNSTKLRLLIGRTTAAFILGSVCLILFYTLIGLDTLRNYSTLPVEFFYSFFWAELYFLMLLAFTIFFSSFSRSTALVIILVVLLILIVFTILERLIPILGYEGEPLFIISYFSSIITSILAFPAQRYRIGALDVRRAAGSGSGRQFTFWLTPDPLGALIFMVGYTVVFLVLAYFLYEHRQVQ